MGLLDDAIREHFEFRRRRGADPSEVAHEELAALDPTRLDEGSEPVEELTEAEGSLISDEVVHPVDASLVRGVESPSERRDRGAGHADDLGS